MSKQHYLLDAHVHLYPVFDLHELIIKAKENFDRAAANLNVNQEWTGVLCCADLQDQDSAEYFSRFDQLANTDVVIEEDQRPSSIRVKVNGTRLLFIFGYQIICRENLEVLAYGLDKPVANKEPIKHVIDQAIEQQALVILPWSFGKWMFGRGAIIDQLLDIYSQKKHGQRNIFLGDNGGRLRLFRYPTKIAKGVKAGLIDIPGSDPLPFQNQTGKPGTTGSLLDFTSDAVLSGRQLINAINAMQKQPNAFFAGERLLPFIRCQFAMQLRKRKAA